MGTGNRWRESKGVLKDQWFRRNRYISSWEAKWPSLVRRVEFGRHGAGRYAEGGEEAMREAQVLMSQAEATDLAKSELRMEKHESPARSKRSGWALWSLRSKSKVFLELWCVRHIICWVLNHKKLVNLLRSTVVVIQEGQAGSFSWTLVWPHCAVMAESHKFGRLTKNDWSIEALMKRFEQHRISIQMRIMKPLWHAAVSVARSLFAPLRPWGYWRSWINHGGDRVRWLNRKCSGRCFFCSFDGFKYKVFALQYVLLLVSGKLFENHLKPNGLIRPLSLWPTVRMLAVFYLVPLPLRDFVFLGRLFQQDAPPHGSL